MPIRVTAKIKPFVDDAFKLVDAVDIDGEIGIDQVVAAIRDGSIIHAGRDDRGASRRGRQPGPDRGIRQPHSPVHRPRRR